MFQPTTTPLSPFSFLQSAVVQILFDPNSDQQRDAVAAIVAAHPMAVPLGADVSRLSEDADLVCLDADLFAEIPESRRASAWFAPLAWHPDALSIPTVTVRRAALLHQSLTSLFPRAKIQLIPYPLRNSLIRRGDRESIRHRLGLSSGRLAVFCREESSPLIRVMKALEVDERITAVTQEDAHLLDRDHAASAEAMTLSACDLFLAESSPQSVAESLAHGIPLAALVRDGGDVNARLLAEESAGLIAQRPGDLLMQLDMLASASPVSVQKLRRCLEALRHGSAVALMSHRLAAVS